MLGNGVVGILAESVNKWERRAPLTPSHCARLLHGGGGDENRVSRIIVQPSTKRIYHDQLYDDVGCDVAEDLSECGLILGIKQPKLEMILPDRAYAFFSHTHKAQKENMPLLDKVLAERATLYDYELIAGDHSERLLAFGKYAGRAGMIDFLHGLGQRYLSLGYSTPFLSLASSYMYSSLASAKAAVISVGEEIATQGLHSGICPLVFVFTGSGNVSHGAQEIFKLLPHSFVEPDRLPLLYEKAKSGALQGKSLKRVFQVYGCVITSHDMVEPTDQTMAFDKLDYYSHPENYIPIFHERIAPYASVIVNCMYWERRFPRLLDTSQLRELIRKGCPLMGICDITCDLGGSIEFIKESTTIDSPFLRYDPWEDSYDHDMDGDGVICMAVDILPTEFAKEASQHFGDILSQFVGSLASISDIKKLPPHLNRACIVHEGALTSLFEYIPRMRKSNSENHSDSHAGRFSSKEKYTTLVSLNGHLFDQFLINEALDKIESAGGSFHLVKCHLGQSTDTKSYSQIEVGANDKAVLNSIIDSLTQLANPTTSLRILNKKNKNISPRFSKKMEIDSCEEHEALRKTGSVLILGAGRVCRPAAKFLASVGNASSQWYSDCLETTIEGWMDIHIIVGSLSLKDAKATVKGIRNAKGVQLDISNKENLFAYISEVDVVVSLLPPSCHVIVANACIELKRHLVTASYVDGSMSKLNERAKDAGITILGEMGLDPGIDHMMAMKMIDQAHEQKGQIKSFKSYCGGLPSPAAANNPLGYKFSWSPAGAIRAGQNPATYKYNNQIVHIKGDRLYDSAEKFRVPDLPSLALECLPNRNSLDYGALYGIEHEAKTIFRGTLRYEGFGKIMGTLARLGLFNSEVHQALSKEARPTFREFLIKHVISNTDEINGGQVGEKNLGEKLLGLGHKDTATETAKTLVHLGFHDEEEIPTFCKSPFDVTCLRMEEKLSYSSTEQDMVLLHHELEIEFPEEQITEKHRATLLEFGNTHDGNPTTAMATTVGITAGIGALLLVLNEVKSRGVLIPVEPEIYLPATKILKACGIKLKETAE